MRQSTLAKRADAGQAPAKKVYKNLQDIKLHEKNRTRQAGISGLAFYVNQVHPTPPPPLKKKNAD